MRKIERSAGVIIGLVILLLVVQLVAGRSSLSFKQQFGNQSDTDSSAAPESLVAVVVEVQEEGTRDTGWGTAGLYQKLLVRVESGSLQGQTVVVEQGVMNTISSSQLFRAGDRVYLERVTGPEGDHLYVADFVRTNTLLQIAGLFLVLVALIGWIKGLRSLAGTLFSFLVIFAFVLPQIIAGQNPLTVSLIGAVVLLTGATYVTFGWNLKAHAAVAGMLLSLAITGFLASWFVAASHLTGLGAEESTSLVVGMGSAIDLRGLLLGGIIIGTLGVLDDICVGQSSAVFELAQANPNLDWWQLFRRSLNIGRDHISASVNTLLLAYAGASMPLLLVFSLYQEPLLRRLNRESVAEEIVRALVGSIGLVLSVPITGFIASLLAAWQQRQGEESRQRLLALLAKGKPRPLPELAAAVGASPEAIREMLEDMASESYLRLIPGECPGRCQGCSLSLACVAGDGNRVWTLTREGQEAAGAAARPVEVQETGSSN